MKFNLDLDVFDVCVKALKKQAKLRGVTWQELLTSCMTGELQCGLSDYLDNYIIECILPDLEEEDLGESE